MSHRILVVDDEPDITALVAYHLAKAGYRVSTAANGPDALKAAREEKPDIVILDVMLPGVSGYDVLAELRRREETREVGVILLTAKREEPDRIRGLSLGADDYLIKPFDLQELLARMRAVIRRQGGQAAPMLSNGKVSLDPGTRMARAGGAEIQLSSREFSLLQALLLRPGMILARTELEERIYGWNEEVESNAVDFLIHGVRKGLGASVIKNVRGAGWMVEKPS